MFAGRLSEITANEVRAIIENEVAEGADFELKRELPVKKGQDPWMTGGKIGDNAKDELAAEIIAFANSGGGALIVGIAEDKATKGAVAPIYPIPRCKEAAERLHQAIGDRIEPKLPSFECEGIVTEQDGSSGVIIIRTLQSYLAPHRHTQDRHCYIRRNDRAEPMSMAEIHNLVQRSARTIEEIELAFIQSSNRFFSWIPESLHIVHPKLGITGRYEPNQSGTSDWIGGWALRLTAKPLAPLPIVDLPRQPWLRSIKLETFNGGGRQGALFCNDVEVERQWQPRLRSVEFTGDGLTAVDRIAVDGQIDRFARIEISCDGLRPRYLFISLPHIMWHFASIIRMADIVRSESFRPAQTFGLEVELVPSDKLTISGYPGIVPSGVQLIPGERAIFPRYEIGTREEFDNLLTVFDRDVWNLAGHHPNWQLSLNWPSAKVG